MEHIAFDYDVSKSAICESVQRVGKVLVSCPDFHLLNRSKLINDTDDSTILMVVASEYEIKRPKEKEKGYYSGKKRNTLKLQVIINFQIVEILKLSFEKGSERDFSLFKTASYLFEKTGKFRR